MIFWGGWTQDEGDFGLSGVSGRGAAYDPGNDRWRRIARAPIAPRGGHLAVWTGSKMLGWGGYGERGPLVDGALYDPASDTWRTMSPFPESLGLDFRHALQEEFTFGHGWAGSEWILGYQQDVNDEEAALRLAAYDPAADGWRDVLDLQAAGLAGFHVAWTGSEVILASYDQLWRIARDDDEWRSVSSTPWRLPVYLPVWTGDRLLAVITRWSDEPWSFVAQWDPATDEWTALPQPPTSAEGELLWDGEHAIPFGSGLAYDVASSSWWNVPMAVSGSRTDHVTVWTGREVVVWGGWVCGKCPQGVYDKGLVLTPNW